MKSKKDYSLPIVFALFPNDGENSVWLAIHKNDIVEG